MSFRRSLLAPDRKSFAAYVQCVSTRLIALLAPLVVAGCRDGGIAEWFGGATVYGRVVRIGGTGVPGITVQAATAVPGNCTAALVGALGGADVLSDNTGGFRIDMGGFGVSGTFCVKVIAIPPLQSGLLPPSATVPALQFGQLGDSARVDLVLLTP